jgi:thiol-disulfide isomerase/thioredoxin
MRTLRCCALLAALLLPGAAFLSAQEKADNKIEVKFVKYDDLGDLVNQHKGKVVVVDCWWLDCAPCLKEMPRLQAMQAKYGKDGFVGITACVKLDETVDNDEIQQTALKRLAERKMTGTTNVILDEGIAVWQKNLRFASVPHVFVFDRDGKWREYGDKDKDVNYDKIEQKVVELLGKGK